MVDIYLLCLVFVINLSFNGYLLGLLFDMEYLVDTISKTTMLMRILTTLLCALSVNGCSNGHYGFNIPNKINIEILQDENNAIKIKNVTTNWVNNDLIVEWMVVDDGSLFRTYHGETQIMICDLDGNVVLTKTIAYTHHPSRRRTSTFKDIFYNQNDVSKVRIVFNLFPKS